MNPTPKFPTPEQQQKNNNYRKPPTRFVVQHQLARKLKLVTQLRSEEVGTLFLKYKKQYAYRYIIKNGKIGVLVPSNKFDYENFGPYVKILWVDKDYGSEEIFGMEEAHIEEWQDCLTPYFHNSFFITCLDIEDQLEIKAIHDNSWKPLSIDWYEQQLDYWFKMNSYVLMEFFPYNALRGYMLQQSGRKAVVEKQLVQQIKGQLEAQVNQLVDGDEKVIVEEQVCAETLKDIQKLGSKNIKLEKVSNKYDISKMDQKRVIKFLGSLFPKYAPEEFYELHLNSLLPMKYVKRCPSADTFMEVLKVWKGRNR